jgi:hypothetical protein
MILRNTVINSNILNAYFHLLQNKHTKGEIVRIININQLPIQDTVAIFINITI